MLGINAEVLDWKDKPLGYHLKANPGKVHFRHVQDEHEATSDGKEGVCAFSIAPVSCS
jgi:hypothetical protein